MSGKSLVVIAQPRKNGRPSAYTPALALEICLRLAEGESLRTICLDSRIPSVGTVLRWVFLDVDGFQEQYARARRIQAELRFDEIIDIADTPMIGVVITQKEKHTEVREGDMLEHRRLRIDARKWTASKLLPKKYGNEPIPEPADGSADTPAVIIRGGLPD